MKIVELQNGKFAIKKGWWIFSQCLDNSIFKSFEDNWWPILGGFAGRNSLFDTYEEASKKMDAYKAREKSKEFKIKRVIS